MLFCTGALSGGAATSVATTLLPPGTSSITAAYAGDTNYVGSTNSLAGGQVVTNTVWITGITLRSTNSITGYGTPNSNYILERTTNLTLAVWVDISTNAAAYNGVINAMDKFSDLGGRPPALAYYRLQLQP